MEEFKEKVEIALKTSPIHQVLIDKSLIVGGENVPTLVGGEGFKVWCGL